MPSPLELAMQADPEFVELCQLLYGDSVDSERVWEDVFAKMSPDSSDLNTGNRPRKQKDWSKTLSRASNAVGISAGLAATGPALSNEKLKEGGRVSRKVQSVAESGVKRVQATRPGAKYVKWVAKPKNAAKLAGGGALLQVGNIAGDALTSRVLARQQAKGKVKKSDTVQMKPVTPEVPKTAATAKKVARKAVDVGTKHPYIAAAGVGATYLGAKKAKTKFAPQPQYSGGYIPDYAMVKRDVTWEGEFSKLDDDKRLAFGWASVTSVDGVPVVDSQADYIHPDDLEDAAYRYVMKSRKGGDMHRRSTDDYGADVPFHVSDLVESFVLTPEKIEKMGLPKNTKTGWWVGFKFHDDDAWSDIKKGKRTGFSIHGRGHRRDVDYDDVMTGA